MRPLHQLFAFASFSALFSSAVIAAPSTPSEDPVGKLADVVAAPTRPVSIATLRAGHPRLIFTQERLDDLRARMKTDPLLVKLIERTRQRSDEIAAGPTVAYKPMEPFNEFGKTILLLSRHLLERTTAHAFMYRVTGERLYADRVWREVQTMLDYPDWNPAHVLDPAEMTVAAAFAYDWVYDAWTPEQRKLLREAIVNRGVKPILAIHETRSGPSKGFVTTAANWNSVGNGGLLSGALAVAEDEPALAAKALSFAVPALGKPKKTFEPDGGYDEGPTYWSYGTDFYVLAASVLKSALGDDAGLLEGKAFAGSAVYRLHVQSPNGRNWMYGDTWPISNAFFGYTVLTSMYGPAPASADIREGYTKYLTEIPPETHPLRLNPLGYLWLPPEQPPNAFKNAALDAFFGGTAELAMMRGAWGDPRTAHVGFKAGHVEHSHNHLDSGSFVFTQAGVHWSTDLGPEDYQIFGYFRKRTGSGLPLNAQTRNMVNRWQFLRANNYGHSTLTLGGALQNPYGVAPFIAKGSHPNFAFTVADMSDIYPLYAKKWQRGIALVDRAWVSVRDEIKGLKKDTEAEWVMMTEAKVEIANDCRSATLSRDGETMQLSLAKAPAGACITAAPALPATARENQNEGVTRLVISWYMTAPNEELEVHLVPPSFKGATPEIGALAGWKKRK
jgi:hypothetical protein